MCVCNVSLLSCMFGCACVYVLLTFAIYIYVYFVSFFFFIHISVGGDSIVGTGVRLMNLGAAIYLPVWGIMM